MTNTKKSKTQTANVTAYEKLFNSIVARNNVRPSKDNETALKLMFTHEVAIKKALNSFDDSIINKVISANSDSAKGEDFIAVKAQVKLINMLRAIGQNLVSVLDNYSATIISNALINNNVMLSKSALVCLSKDIEYNELDSVQIIKSRMRKAASTASTQRSSTREMLRFLNLADCKKSVKDDSIILTDSGKALFTSLFA